MSDLPGKPTRRRGHGLSTLLGLTEYVTKSTRDWLESGEFFRFMQKCFLNESVCVLATKVPRVGWGGANAFGNGTLHEAP